MLNARVRKKIARMLGESDVTCERAHGSAFVSLFVVHGRRGVRAFMKYEPASSPMLASEAAGLVFLRDHGLRVPDVYGYDSADEGSFVLMAYVPRGRATSESWTELAEHLTACHGAAVSGAFGAVADNYLANIPQDNSAAPNAFEFYRRRRVEPLLDKIRAAGILDPEECRRVLAFVDRFEKSLSTCVEARPVHGDLWSGNIMFDLRGRYYVIDPAVSFNHPATDWAMMSLFGSFPASIWKRCPIEASLLTLYKIYPLLVHVLIYGASFVPPLMDICDRPH